VCPLRHPTFCARYAGSAGVLSHHTAGPCSWRPLREIIALLLQRVLAAVAVLFNLTVYQLDYARSYRTYEDA
jgi:hypothetical protein